jgi:hypothetical protein
VTPSIDGGYHGQVFVLLTEAAARTAVLRSPGRAGKSTRHQAFSDTSRKYFSEQSCNAAWSDAAVAAVSALAASATLGATAANAAPNCGDAATWYGVTLRGTQYLNNPDGVAYPSQFTFDNNDRVKWTINPDNGTNLFSALGQQDIRIATPIYIIDLIAMQCEDGHVTRAAAISIFNGGVLRSLMSAPLTSP